MVLWRCGSSTAPKYHIFHIYGLQRAAYVQGSGGTGGTVVLRYTRNTELGGSEWAHGSTQGLFWFLTVASLR